LTGVVRRSKVTVLRYIHAKEEVKAEKRRKWGVDRSNTTTVRKTPSLEAARYGAATRLTLDMESTWNRETVRTAQGIPNATATCVSMKGKSQLIRFFALIRSRKEDPDVHEVREAVVSIHSTPPDDRGQAVSP